MNQDLISLKQTDSSLFKKQKRKSVGKAGSALNTNSPAKSRNVSVELQRQIATETHKNITMINTGTTTHYKVRKREKQPSSKRSKHCSCTTKVTDQTRPTDLKLPELIIGSDSVSFRTGIDSKGFNILANLNEQSGESLFTPAASGLRTQGTEVQKNIDITENDTKVNSPEKSEKEEELTKIQLELLTPDVKVAVKTQMNFQSQAMNTQTSFDSSIAHNHYSCLENHKSVSSIIQKMEATQKGYYSLEHSNASPQKSPKKKDKESPKKSPKGIFSRSPSSNGSVLRLRKKSKKRKPIFGQAGADNDHQRRKVSLKDLFTDLDSATVIANLNSSPLTLPGRDTQKGVQRDSERNEDGASIFDKPKKSKFHDVFRETKTVMDKTSEKFTSPVITEVKEIEISSPIVVQESPDRTQDNFTVGSSIYDEHQKKQLQKIIKGTLDMNRSGSNSSLIKTKKSSKKSPFNARRSRSELQKHSEVKVMSPVSQRSSNIQFAPKLDGTKTSLFGQLDSVAVLSSTRSIKSTVPEERADKISDFGFRVNHTTLELIKEKHQFLYDKKQGTTVDDDLARVQLENLSYEEQLKKYREQAETVRKTLRRQSRYNPLAPTLNFLPRRSLMRGKQFNRKKLSEQRQKKIERMATIAYHPQDMVEASDFTPELSVQEEKKVTGYVKLPKYYVKGALTAKQLQNMPTAEEKLLAAQHGYFLPPLGGKPYDFMGLVTEDHKKKYKELWGYGQAKTAKEMMEASLPQTEYNLYRANLQQNVQKGQSTYDFLQDDQIHSFIKKMYMKRSDVKTIQLAHEFADPDEADSPAKMEGAIMLHQTDMDISRRKMRENLFQKKNIERQSFQIISFYKSHEQWASEYGADFGVKMKRRHKHGDYIGAEIASNYDNPFFNLLLSQHETTVSLSNKVKDNLQEIALFKREQGSSIYEKRLDDHKFQYLTRCQKDLNLALPLLDKVIGKTLVLQSYTLSQGHCNALAVACSLFDKSINRVLFDNCGIDDDEFSEILNGLNHLQDFKSIIYKQNVFDEKSMDSIVPLFHKKLPNHLEELRVIDCKINYRVSQKLVDAIVFKSQISRLALVKANITEATFATLCQFFKSSPHLQQIDLTWCEIQQSSWPPFFQILKNNKKLTHLTLSNNTFFHDSNPAQTQLLMDQLCHFLKRNANLQHVNLTQTDLTEDMLKQIGACLRRAYSLRAIHLCGNPGISEGLISWFRTRIHAMGERKVHKLDHHFSSEVEQFEIKNIKDKAFAEAQYLQYVLKEKVVGAPHSEMPGEKNKLICTRKIGFKEICPGIGQWQVLTKENDKCWICDQHALTVFLWSEEIGNDLSIKDYLAEDYFDNQIRQINAHQTPQRYDPQSDAPVIYGYFNWWQGTQMEEIGSFVKRLDPRRPNFFKQMQREADCRAEINSIEEMDKDELERYNQRVKQYEQRFYGFGWTHHLMNLLGFKKPTIINGLRACEQLDKELHELHLEAKPIYIYVDFIKPGKLHYAVKTIDQFKLKKTTPNTSRQTSGLTFEQQMRDKTDSTYFSQSQLFLHKQIVRGRDEDIPAFKKQSRRAIERRFFKGGSVFSQFKGETDETYEACFENDRRYWKLWKFIKLKTDLNATELAIKENYRVFKQVFDTIKASGKTVNSITSFEFRQFSKTVLILGDNLTKREKKQKMDQGISFCLASDLDRFFIAANREDGVKQDDNPDHELVRYEFTEILIRIADKRYREKGMAKSFKEAALRLVQEILEPFYDKEFGAWENFRENSLWSLDVNDLFQANLKEIKSLYKRYAQLPHKLKQVNQKNTDSESAKMIDCLVVDNCYQLCCHDSELGLKEREVRQWFSMSKQTVVNDNDEKGQLQYQRMTFVEFLEFIGRISIIKFAGTELEDLGLAEKIAYVLDDLFAVIGVTRNEVEVEQEEVSESDEDY